MTRLFSARRLNGLILLGVCLFSTATFLPVYGGDAGETSSRLLGGIKYLASDALEGRGVGTEGLNKAAEFVRDAFREAGLNVAAVDGAAFQKFSMITGTELGETNTLRLAGPDGKIIELKYDSDFQTCSFGGSGSFAGDVVFGGYAIDAKDQNYQDFEGIDLQGKIVVIMRRNPQQGHPHGGFGGPSGRVSQHAALRSKVSNAFGKGAAAILFVNDPYTVRKNAEDDRKLVGKETERVAAAAEAFLNVDSGDENKLAEARTKLAEAVDRLKAARKAEKQDDNDPLMKFGYGGNPGGGSLPILHVSQAAIDQMLAASLKKSLAALEAEIDADLKPRTTPLEGWTAQGETSVKHIRTEIKNVIGVLEGEGPLADETVVIGAHYDHVGMGGPGSLAPGSKAVHNGADDNASGTVSLIELARRFASRKQKLPRRVVFIAFTAEERGLIGSARYVREPIFPLEKTVAMLNMDMVGRLQNDKLIVFGTGTAPRWKPLLEEVGRRHKFKLSLKPEGFGPSDHSSFYGKKIPVLHFFSGTHRDYHRPTDDWEKINVEGMVRIVDMIEQIALTTIETKDRPQYVEVSGRAQAARTGSRPYFGSIPDFGGEAKGYAISGVAPASPAAKGGLKGGDVIVQLGQQKIGNLSDFDLALRKHSPGDEVPVVVLRKGKQVKLKVILGKPR